MSRETIKYGKKTYTILFPELIRPLHPREQSALENSIRESGIIVPVVVDEEDGIIDGANRLRLAAYAGRTDVPFDVRRGLTPEQKLTLAHSLNEARRQMSVADKRRARQSLEKEAKRLRAEGKSIRQIAEEMGIPHATAQRAVASVSPDTLDAPPARRCHRTERQAVPSKSGRGPPQRAGPRQGDDASPRGAGARDRHRPDAPATGESKS